MKPTFRAPTTLVLVAVLALGLTAGWFVRPVSSRATPSPSPLGSATQICPQTTASGVATHCGPILIGVQPHTIAVTGTGVINARPDEAVIYLGVQTSASSANAALRLNASRMTAVLQALARAGVASRDIATASVNLSPDYSGSGSSAKGFTADNEVTVTLHTLSKVGQVIDSAVAAGANVTGGVTFQLSNQSTGRSVALKAAVADARSQAEVLAAAAGGTLGQVVSIDATSGGPQIYARDAAGVAAPGVPTPISPPQSVQTQVSVTVVWALQG
jgi:uncharacterized protein YggE